MSIFLTFFEVFGPPMLQNCNIQSILQINWDCSLPVSTFDRNTNYFVKNKFFRKSTFHNFHLKSSKLMQKPTFFSVPKNKQDFNYLLSQVTLNSDQGFSSNAHFSGAPGKMAWSAPPIGKRLELKFDITTRMFDLWTYSEPKIVSRKLVA